MNGVTPIHGLRLLDIRDVSARTNLSRSQIYRKMAAGAFPQNVKLSAQRSAWAEHEIDAWIRAALESRQQPQHQSA
jgi:prophage regulatory protein